MFLSWATWNALPCFDFGGNLYSTSIMYIPRRMSMQTLNNLLTAAIIPFVFCLHFVILWFVLFCILFVFRAFVLCRCSNATVIKQRDRCLPYSQITIYNPLHYSSPITQGHLGVLERFDVKSYDGKSSALMFCEGKQPIKIRFEKHVWFWFRRVFSTHSFLGQPQSFRTLILRGGDLHTLAVVKRVLRYGLHALQVIWSIGAVVIGAAATAAAAVCWCPLQCMRLEALYLNANKADLDFDSCNPTTHPIYNRCSV